MITKLQKVLVTSYTNADLDGVASAYAYAELLGEKATFALFGTPHIEAQYALDKLNIKLGDPAEKIVQNYDQIILLDTSELANKPKEVEPSKVVEIIDHRKAHEADKFPNAEAQIELVGAAATLVAERFKQQNIKLSREAATLLYLAIASHTINFKAKTTTQRDLQIADWLKNQISIPEDLVHELFVYKSKLTRPLKTIFLEDYAIYPIGNKTRSILQLEIVDVENFIKERLAEIKENMLQIRNEQPVDFLFLTCIDIEKGFNMFIVIDDETEKLLSRTFSISFNNGVARKEGIIMRKEIVPALKEAVGL